jgi:hypothetical protein
VLPALKRRKAGRREQSSLRATARRARVCMCLSLSESV